jgi:ABC-type sugar transport system permease subunit
MTGRLAGPIRLLAILAVVLLAAGLRARAIERLPIDYDEDDYLRAAQEVAAVIQSGEWAGLTQTNYRPEHPPLAKLAFGLGIALLPPSPLLPDVSTSSDPARRLPQPQFTVARVVAGGFGTLTVLALALVDPLAALLLASGTWEIKYTSQVMLEALPSLTSALSVFAYLRAWRPAAASRAWLALSAVMLGLTAAGKYLYVVAGIAVLIDWLWRARPAHLDARARARWLRPIAAWGLLGVLVFFLADLYLWPDPLGRLRESVLFHAGYAESAHVQAAGFPPWQPLVWLSGSVPWHPGVFLVSADLFVSLLALLGLRRLWRRERVYVLWLAVALIFLLLWPTKWPQYILILTVPLAIAAAEGTRTLIADLGLRIADLAAATAANLKSTIRNPKSKMAVPWLLPGALVLVLITAYPLVFQGAMALTDFSAFSIRDGLQGGVWRAVRQGLTGQEPAAPITLYGGFVIVHPEVRDRGEPAGVPGLPGGLAYDTQVHYVGPGLFWGLLSGAVSATIVFELIWTTATVGLQTALGVAVALLLHRRGVRFRGAWLTLFILPWALPEFVGALVWAHVFEPTNGWISLALGAPLHWREDPLQALLVLVAGAVWLGWPFMLVAASAGLEALPAELFDAAALDGASGWQRFRLITWPLLQPLLVPAIIIRTIFAFNQFYLFYMMGAGYPLATFASVSYFLFDTNRGTGGQFAVSAALNLITVCVLAVLVLAFNRWSKAAEGVTYA